MSSLERVDDCGTVIVRPVGHRRRRLAVRRERGRVGAGRRVAEAGLLDHRPVVDVDRHRPAGVAVAHPVDG